MTSTAIAFVAEFCRKLGTVHGVQHITNCWIQELSDRDFGKIKKNHKFIIDSRLGSIIHCPARICSLSANCGKETYIELGIHDSYSSCSLLSC